MSQGGDIHQTFNISRVNQSIHGGPLVVTKLKKNENFIDRMKLISQFR